jgi:hypothetical protein
MGLWFALEDCTESNGCLSFVFVFSLDLIFFLSLTYLPMSSPGSHKRNPLSKRLVRLPEGGTDIVPVPGYEDAEKVDWDAEGVEWKSAACEAGGAFGMLLLFLPSDPVPVEAILTVGNADVLTHRSRPHPWRRDSPLGTELERQESVHLHRLSTILSSFSCFSFLLTACSVPTVPLHRRFS